jgi:hypothetical protein
MAYVLISRHITCPEQTSNRTVVVTCQLYEVSAAAQLACSNQQGLVVAFNYMPWLQLQTSQLAWRGLYTKQLVSSWT